MRPCIGQFSFLLAEADFECCQQTMSLTSLRESCAQKLIENDLVNVPTSRQIGGSKDISSRMIACECPACLLGKLVGNAPDNVSLGSTSIPAFDGLPHYQSFTSMSKTPLARGDRTRVPNQNSGIAEDENVLD